MTQQLASCTTTDFGLWVPEQKSVAKHRVPSKILCAAWSNDGQNLITGLFNGSIIVFDRSGVEKTTIRRSYPIWTLTVSPTTEEDLIAVGCWDQTLSFYQIDGTPVGKERRLGFDPCSVRYFSGGQYLVIGGSNRKANLYTRDGVFLSVLAEQNDWIWAAEAKPNGDFVAVGCNDGNVSMHQMHVGMVHSLYQDRYAFREHMTDVIIQHLVTDHKVRIKCRDHVKRIAVYKGKLAVQLQDRVIVYETNPEDPTDMHYRVSERLHENLDCSLLFVTAMHLILCYDKRLQLLNLHGVKEREWVLDSSIRYVKVLGGPSGKEGLLVGTRSGLVVKVFIDTAFPIELVKHHSPVRCLDLNQSKKKLALVDENQSIFVYDLLTKECIFEDEDANSVAWNTVCYYYFKKIMNICKNLLVFETKEKL